MDQNIQFDIIELSNENHDNKQIKQIKINEEIIKFDRQYNLYDFMNFTDDKINVIDAVQIYNMYISSYNRIKALIDEHYIIREITNTVFESKTNSSSKSDCSPCKNIHDLLTDKTLEEKINKISNLGGGNFKIVYEKVKKFISDINDQDKLSGGKISKTKYKHKRKSKKKIKSRHNKKTKKNN